jgi:hypothetical protein
MKHNWILKWAARITAFAVVATFLMIVASEFFPPFHSGPPQRFLDWFGIALLGFAVSGLVIAFRHERIGGILSLACLAVFSAMITMPDRRVLLAFAVPGVLFLLHSATSRTALH